MSKWANIEAEQAVIGGLLSHESGHSLIPKIRPEDFTQASYRKAFEAMARMYDAGEMIDLVTLGGKLEMDTDALVKAMEAMQFVPHSQWSEHYVAALKDASKRRRLLALSTAITRAADDAERDTGETIGKALEALQDMVDGVDEDESMGAVMAETWAMLDDRMAGKDVGVTVGIADFDRMAGGLFPGEMTVIGARPGVGKSAFAQYIAAAFATKNHPVEFFSREMSRIQYGTRMLSMEAGVSSAKFRTGKLNDYELQEAAKALGPITRLPLYINTKAATAAEIKAVCRERKARDGLGLVVVDYLQLVRSVKRTDTRAAEVGEISRSLKELSLELNVPVLALSQLNRNAANKAPTMADLRESGSIEQDADNIILIHEPEDDDLTLEQQRTKQAWDKEGMRYVRLILAKQRQGDTGYIDTAFKPEVMRFFGVQRQAYTTKRDTSGGYARNHTNGE
ncbi:replicative DNA helicase [Gehongia tenuis]|uniref:DNA 5'-3' helicase n=1 Tax=Gehongia tenuis TaxID=2763655 RepID=A0A926D6T7_9FIRM|nr:DnaB-like helicase C-terminal domain-containing protein [Gehongia tenuis]MBC8532407.1 AAA family ATPase [Gehongia tenuis]